MNIDDEDNYDYIDGSDFKKFFEDMESLIQSFNKVFNQFINLKEMNGFKILYIGGAHNHVLTYMDTLVKLYKTIGEKAPGSFGLLYVRLPEDPIFWNQYRVFRLAKGILTEHEDALLSPCVPVIEQ